MGIIKVVLGFFGFCDYCVKSVHFTFSHDDGIYEVYHCDACGSQRVVAVR